MKESPITIEVATLAFTYKGEERIVSNAVRKVTNDGASDLWVGNEIMKGGLHQPSAPIKAYRVDRVDGTILILSVTKSVAEG